MKWNAACIVSWCLSLYNNKFRIPTCDHQHLALSFFLQHFPSRTMGAKQRTSPLDLAPAPPPSVPNVQFRVLIIGRANAGKTSILQRVCDTTESPVIYRSGPSGTRCQVLCTHSQWRFQSQHYPSRLNSTLQQRLEAHILSATADHEGPVDSVASTISRMNSPSRTTMDTFSMTPGDLSQAVKTS